MVSVRQTIMYVWFFPLVLLEPKNIWNVANSTTNNPGISINIPQIIKTFLNNRAFIRAILDSIYNYINTVKDNIFNMKWHDHLTIFDWYWGNLEGLY